LSFKKTSDCREEFVQVNGFAHDQVHVRRTARSEAFEPGKYYNPLPWGLLTDCGGKGVSFQAWHGVIGDHKVKPAGFVGFESFIRSRCNVYMVSRETQHLLQHVRNERLVLDN